MAPHLGGPTDALVGWHTATNHDRNRDRATLDVDGEGYGDGDVYNDGDGDGDGDGRLPTAVPACPETGAATDVDAPVPPHPLGIKPLGNKYLSPGADARTAAGGFQALPDALLMHLLEQLDDAAALRRLGSTCRFLHAFCMYDELWKSLALAHEGWLPAAWRGTWRASFLQTGTTANRPEAPPAVSVDCGRVFSDVLHRPWVCSHADPARFARGIPAANQIRRLPDLSHAEFEAAWSSTPFVLTANRCVRAWPVLRRWSLAHLRHTYADTALRAEAVDWPYALYDAYMRSTADESPLYLFDKAFAERMGVRVGAAALGAAAVGAADPLYWPPACFGPDLFAVLGAQRPAHRWLIVGPARSGSTFHKDPNGTSAWNAVVCGAKYWVLFPPGARVPGVFVSADGGEVTSPLSIAEWLLTCHAAARATPGCIESVCRAGEILHVPSGWWHLVVNLEPGIALTQNFVPRAHLADVLLFLRDRPEQVTGFARRDRDTATEDPYALFVERLAAHDPAQLAAAQADMARRDSRRKRTWEAVVHGDAETPHKRRASEEGGEERGGGGFTFGFGADDDSDLEDLP